MDGQWTYSNLDIEWVHDTYNDKAEAIQAAKETYEEGCYVGQLEYQDGIYYKVVNQEKMLF